MLKNYTLVISILLLVSACGSAKKAEKSVESGDYDNAFNIAITELTKDKNKKSNQKLIPTLKNAFDKAADRDLHKIKLLKKDNNTNNLKKIYALYVSMDVRQDDVISIQPLYIENKEVKFNLKDYSKEIEASLLKYSSHLYTTGTQQLAGSKLDARKAFETFNNLEYINPNYVGNLSSLVTQAKKKGSSIVLIKLQNKIQQLTTQDQTDELMRISSSNMNNQWVIFHDKKDYNTTYDYETTVILDQSQITPEQINTETVQQQAQVRDGWEYVYDHNGNVAKDSLGNDIKRDKIITVQAEVKLFQQLKTSRVDGAFVIKNARTNTQMSSTPILGEAKFENVFAQFRGDQRAIEEKYVQALQNKEAPFPVDEEFIKYALADFKSKMLQLLNQQRF